MLCVPLLAVSGGLAAAGLLRNGERVGKAVRTPARDTMLAQASAKMGRGYGFGLHEALDQTGAMASPLLIALDLCYRVAFAVLACRGGSVSTPRSPPPPCSRSLAYHLTTGHLLPASLVPVLYAAAMAPQLDVTIDPIENITYSQANITGTTGPVTCSITGTPVAFLEASLTGTVTGTITWLG